MLSLILSIEAIEQAFADTAAAAPSAGISQFLVLGGFLLIFYFLSHPASCEIEFVLSHDYTFQKWKMVRVFSKELF